MRITTKGRYALRAMANLAVSVQAKPKSIKIIAAEEDISPEFLEQIFFKLKKAGIIDSVRGPGGGFKLQKSPNDISVREIFIAVDEGLDITPCSVCDDKGVSVCEKHSSCLVHDVWRGASDHINKYFEDIKLQTIASSPKGQALGKILAGESIVEADLR